MKMQYLVVLLETFLNDMDVRVRLIGTIMAMRNVVWHAVCTELSVQETVYDELLTLIYKY